MCRARTCHIEDPIANEPPFAAPTPHRACSSRVDDASVHYAALVALVVGRLALVRGLAAGPKKCRRRCPPPPLESHEGFYAVRPPVCWRAALAEFYESSGNRARYPGDRYVTTGSRALLAKRWRARRSRSARGLLQCRVHSGLGSGEFARRTPTEAECSIALERAEAIVIARGPRRLRPCNRRRLTWSETCAPSRARARSRVDRLHGGGRGRRLAYPSLIAARLPRQIQRWFLLGLLAVPLAFWRGIWGEDRRIPRLRLGTLAPLRVGPSGLRVWLRDLPGVLRAVALTLFVLALARPIDTLKPQTADEEGIDMVLRGHVGLDASGSVMVPEDLARYIPAKTRKFFARLDGAKAVTEI